MVSKFVMVMCDVFGWREEGETKIEGTYILEGAVLERASRWIQWQRMRSIGSMAWTMRGGVAIKILPCCCGMTIGVKMNGNTIRTQ